MSDANKYGMELERIFEEAYNLMAEAKRVPFTDRLMIDESDMSSILDDLREAIPKEVKIANEILEEQKKIVNKAYADAENIISNAKNQAENIVGSARAEAERMVQEQEIVKEANNVAEEVKAAALNYQKQIQGEADEYALHVKKDALEYSEEMLAYISNTLSSALEGCNNNRSSIASEMRNIASPASFSKGLDEEE
ncbi:MAG: hypothetical protein MJ050_00285 [Phascolarctobacterium sp.]|nr:hypothetical protein [Phascolarctobacterium sp.]